MPEISFNSVALNCFPAVFTAMIIPKPMATAVCDLDLSSNAAFRG